MQQRAVLITGAARRIGAAIAQTLHGAGMDVVLHYRRSRESAEALAAELERARAGSTRILQGDLLDVERLPCLVEEAARAFGGLDGLVNNASSFHATPFGRIAPGDWEDLMGSNLRAPLFLAQAAAPHLAARHGAIVNVVDIHAERPLRDYLVYSIAKSGLAGLTRALAVELAPHVRVNGVSPGAILWPDGGADFDPEERSRIVAQTLLATTGRPEDLAGAVKYLLCDAPFVTGQIIAVDGGRSLHI